MSIDNAISIMIEKKNQRITELEEKLAEAQPYLKDGESVAECLERNRRDAGRAILAMGEAQDDAERYRWLEGVIHYTDSEDGLTWAVIDYNFGPSSLAESSLSAAIDAAMESE